MEAVQHYLGITDWEEVAGIAVRVVAILLAIKIATLALRLTLKRYENRLIDEDTSPVEMERLKRAQTLTRLLRQASVIAVWIVGGMYILLEFGVSLGPMLASAGIAGIAVGFGAQSLVRDVISGFFIILEDQISVGDVAVINGTSGIVEKMTLRITVLRDLEGTVHVFPNGKIDSLSNRTSDWSAYVLDMGVAYKEDTDRVVEVMEAVASDLRKDEHFGKLILEDLEVFGVDKFVDSAVNIRVRIKTKPIRQWEVGREYNRRLKQAFDREGIEIPFPHRTLYAGDASKPFRVERLPGQPASEPEHSQ